MNTPLLKIENLSIAFGASRVVENISLEITAGESVGLVGESGSGKSVSALSVLQLLPKLATYPSGKILFKGENLLQTPPARLRQVRREDVGMVFQEPLSALNPLHTIAQQVGEMMPLAEKTEGEKTEAILNLLEEVGLDFTPARLKNFPHQLSGGQRQRVMIAMAMANQPDLFIADEPTTALDVTVQAQIIALMKELQAKHNQALLLISHDLDVVARMTERVYVMHQGKIVEAGKTQDVFTNPQHPYTQALIGSEPSGKPPAPKQKEGTLLLKAEKVKVWFPVKGGLFRKTIGYIKAVEEISFSLHKGHSLGLVGESGSGKTSLGLALLRLIDVRGKVVFLSRELGKLDKKTLRALRPSMQMVFQDPFGSLSPRMVVGDIITEGVRAHQKEEKNLRHRAAQALEEVGLTADMQDRYPHEFSGGQRQRIAIARALALRPALIVLDEPTSGLDRAVQSKIVALLQDLQKKHNLAFIFISHDLKIVKMLADDIIVLKGGKVMEQGAAKEIWESPQHPYTKELLKAAFERWI